MITHTTIDEDIASGLEGASVRCQEDCSALELESEKK